MGNFLDKAGLTQLKGILADKFATKLDRHPGTQAGQFLQTDENGDAVWGTPASQAVVVETTEDWLEEHLTGSSSFAIDSSLSVQGAAADAKATGDAIAALDTELDTKAPLDSPTFSGTPMIGTEPIATEDYADDAALGLIDDTAGIGDDTNVWSADKSAKEVNTLDAAKANAESVYAYKEASGSIVTVDDAVADAVKEIQIGIEPKQDLHGYDHPWVGGAGKNLIKLTLSEIKAANTAGSWNNNVYTYNNVVYTIEQDHDGNVIRIRVKNTATVSAQSSLSLGTFQVEANKTYRINGCPSTGSYEAFLQRVIGTVNDTGTGNTFTSTEAATKTADILVKAGSTVNAIFYPMVSLSSESATFAPYTNICPISGSTELELTRTGKNLLDIGNNLSEWYYATQNGARTQSSHVTDAYIKADINSKTGSINVTYYNTTGYNWAMKWIDLKPNTDYVVNSNFKFVIYGTYSKEDNSQGYMLRDSSASTTTFNSGNYKYYYITFYPENYSISGNNYICPASETEPGFAPYEGGQYELSFPTSAGTVYGGTLTVNQNGSGMLVIDKAKASVTGLYWNNGHSFYKDVTPKPKASLYKTYELISDKIPTRGITTSAQAIDAIFINDSNIVRIQTAKEYTQASDVLADFGGSIDVCYLIESPVTYQLTAPEVIKLLEGKNNIFADTGDILKLTYPVRDYYTKAQADVELVSTDNLSWREATGNPITIDALKGVAKQVKVKIEPKQDLHGYGKPWVGGSGKNLLPMTGDNTATINGVTWKKREDGAIVAERVSSNSNASDYVFSSEVSLPAGTYYFTYYDLDDNGAPSTASTYRASIYYGGTNHWAFGPTIFTLEASDTIHVVLRMYSGFNATTIFKPMIQNLEGATYGFEPYENICPITGFTGTEVKVGKGENIASAIASGVYNSNDGVQIAANTVCHVEANVEANKRYYARMSVDGIRCILYYWNGSTFINSVNIVSNEKIFDFVTPNGCTKMAIGLWAPPGEVDYFEIGEATDYQIAFPDSAGTVYGGTVTVNDDGTGMLVVDKASKTVSEMGASSLAMYSAGVFYSSSKVAKGKSDIISSDYYSGGTRNIDNLPNNEIAVDSNGYFHFRDDRYSTLSALLENSSARIVWELPTSITYTLTAPQIRTLLGENHIYGDSGDITILYPYDYNCEQYAQMVYETESTPAAVMTVTDGADDVPVKELKINIEPVQDLHGYSKPWIGGTGKNLLAIEFDMVSQDSGVYYYYSKKAGTVKAYGSCSDMSSSLITKTLPAGRYYVSGCPAGANDGSYKYCIAVYVGDSLKAIEYGNGTSFTLSSESTIKVQCFVYAAAGTVNGLTFKPMVCLDSETDKSFEPYENICPISGWKQAKVTRTGKNLLNIPTSVTKGIATFTKDAEGYITASPNNSDPRFWEYENAQYSCFLKAGSYKLIIDVKTSTDESSAGYAIYSSETMITQEAYKGLMGSKVVSFTVSHDGVIYFLFKLYSGKARFMLVHGDETDYSYEEYKGNQHDIVFPSSAGTVYGGTLTVNQDGSGEILKDMGIIGINSFSRGGTSSGGMGFFDVFVTNANSKSSFCSHLPRKDGDLGWVSSTPCYALSSNTIRIYAPQNSNDDLKTAYSDLKIVYHLNDTHVKSYQLRADQVKTLLGVNNIWADTGDIKKLVCPADTKLYMDKKFNELQALVLENIGNT